MRGAHLQAEMRKKERDREREREREREMSVLPTRPNFLKIHSTILGTTSLIT
jgi:hypothetical protein